MNQKYILLGILILAIIGVIFISGCIQKTPNQDNTLSDEEIRAELINLEKINAYPNNKNIDPKDYPKVLGTYSKNGLTLIETYFCSDVCPDSGGVSIVFENIRSKEKCAEIGGKDFIDPAWGGYIGCAPNVE